MSVSTQTDIIRSASIKFKRLESVEFKETEDNEKMKVITYN